MTKQIPNFPKYLASKEGHIISEKGSKPRKLKPCISNGYYQVNLRKKGKTFSCRVHRIVYETFKGPIPNNMEVRHLNDNKLDNRIVNLEIGTHRENINDSILNENDKYLTNDLTNKIREMGINGHNKSYIAQTLSIPESTVDYVCRGDWCKRNNKPPIKLNKIVKNLTSHEVIEILHFISTNVSFSQACLYLNIQTNTPRYYSLHHFYNKRIKRLSDL